MLGLFKGAFFLPIDGFLYGELLTTEIGKRKAKRSFTVSVKTPNGTEDKTTLKGTTGTARLRGSAS
jgi:hypothetical protein